MKVSPEHISSAMSMYYTGMSITDIRNHIRQETGYYPSKSVVFGWIDKYTDLAARHFRDYRPKVGDTWVADETMLDLDKGVKVWFWDVIDSIERYMYLKPAETIGILALLALACYIWMLTP